MKQTTKYLARIIKDKVSDMLVAGQLEMKNHEFEYKGYFIEISYIGTSEGGEIISYDWETEPDYQDIEHKIQSIHVDFVYNKNNKPLENIKQQLNLIL